MSYYDRTHDQRQRSAKPRQSKAAAWTNKVLTNDQKAKLSILARTAYDIQVQAGLIDSSYDDWRYEQTTIACGQPSFRAATQTHFRSILAHYLRLAGKTAEADALWKKSGRVAGSTQIHDTHENREVAKAINGRISEAYVMAIVTNKHAGISANNLTAQDLQNLVYTLKARLRKMA